MWSSIASYIGGSYILGIATVWYAFHLKRWFYNSVGYLVESKVATLILGNVYLATVVLVGKMVQWIFLGQLRFRETERLQIRMREAVVETCLAMSVFKFDRTDFDARFLLFLSILLFMKTFHWLAKDRVDFMEEQPLVPLRSHLRLTFLLLTFLVLDLVLLYWSIIYGALRNQYPILVLFTFEFTLLFITISWNAVRYILLLIDLKMDGRWDDRSTFSFYAELVADVSQLLVYMAFFVYVLFHYSLPLHIIRDIYITFSNFQRRCNDFLRYRKVLNEMNELFPNATEEELDAADRVCIICREDMQSAKKLNCGHLFHPRCLQSWLKRQRICPTCRAAIDFRGGAARRDQAGAGQGQAGDAARLPGPQNALPQQQDGFLGAFGRFIQRRFTNGQGGGRARQVVRTPMFYVVQQPGPQQGPRVVQAGPMRVVYGQPGVPPQGMMPGHPHMHRQPYPRVVQQQPTGMALVPPSATEGLPNPTGQDSTTRANQPGGRHPQTGVEPVGSTPFSLLQTRVPTQNVQRVTTGNSSVPNSSRRPLTRGPMLFVNQPRVSPSPGISGQLSEEVGLTSSRLPLDRLIRMQYQLEDMRRELNQLILEASTEAMPSTSPVLPVSTVSLTSLSPTQPERAQEQAGSSEPTVKAEPVTPLVDESSSALPSSTVSTLPDGAPPIDELRQRRLQRLENRDDKPPTS
uniref:RING-type E3 ubiquitin transferase n=2 Tax=Compsopogon caeruleus TaxID=31354 RepID=A0A7S1TGM3_9RHOD|mmetsp:Transcript_6465/g.12947  ORF Transcript_6465/g.12947 Transcript_6465/m.12947 type:complete len:690 (+) Transcript_6465:288-2357(+)|eukprot:CAMPEP_0184682574 /NCGR_PEP_ID=MMETSP0312-20130426/7819_1 /TAXON_ID=31354 /ORGANISM="Compsopogon coeruleus, Strain SAG 36.94" /LENGTH=689 /DNA_ID=CAMNT_0027134329 /DNA_START=211 /DNA_END=2280 /DNA_ORIENTATION=+